jgi:hypothetical protein
VSDWPTPERLDALIDGATPETEAEREALRVAAEVAGAEPALPPELDARIETLAAPPARRPWAGLRAWMLAPAAVAIAVAVVVVVATHPGDTGPPKPAWFSSSELEGSKSVPPPTELLSDATTQTPGGAPVIETGGPRLIVRSGPGPGFERVRPLDDGDRVRIICVAKGPQILGPLGTSDLWDGLAEGGYVSDAFVFTGTAAPVVPACSR